MADDIDIEDHNLLHNPQLKNIYPDIVEVKEEVYGAEAAENSETEKQKGSCEMMKGNQPPTVNTSLPNTCKYDESISNNIKNVTKTHKVNSESSNSQYYIEISTNIVKAEDNEDENSKEWELIPKKEIFICEACFKESDEEMCKQCVLQSVKDKNEVIRSSVNNTNKAEEIDVIHTPNDASGLEHSSETADKRYSCSFCDYKSIYKSNVNCHTQRKHTNEKKYLCEICEYQFVTRNHLKQHLRTHTGEKPFTCDFCDYRTSHKTSLQYHIKGKHTNDKKYSCDTCEFKCVSKGHLKEHLLKHTGEKPYKCDLCDYGCTQIGHLKNHIKARHTNEKNYSCNMCDYKCVTNSQLNQHLRKHTGEKPFKCVLCDYRCSHSSRIKDHIKAKHTNEKNYTCDMCDYKCVTNSHLKRHQRKHTARKPYRMHVCDYRCLGLEHLKTLQDINCNEKIREACATVLSRNTT